MLFRLHGLQLGVGMLINIRYRSDDFELELSGLCGA